MELIERIKNDLKENLTEYRYIHSLGVMEMAEELATIYKTCRIATRHSKRNDRRRKFKICCRK